MQAIIFSAGMSGPASNISDVRTVLDTVAERIAPSAWYGRMSASMLTSVRRALVNTIPSRKAFVIAYLVEGFSHKRIRPLWTVGKRGVVNENGQWIVERRFAKKKAPSSPLQGMTGEIARAAFLAGLTHDIGKDTTHFQDKLRRSGIIADPVRHEVVSVARMLKHPVTSWCAPWKQGESHGKMKWHHYLVLSHHRLPLIHDFDGGIDLVSQKHVRPGLSEQDMAESDIPACGAASPALLSDPPSVCNAAGFIYSRLALMLADHYVSSLDSAKTGALAHVTRRIVEPEPGKTMANSRQGLMGHMIAIGRIARSLSRRLINGNWMAGMGAVSSDRLIANTPSNGRFAWQGHAVNTVSEYVRSIPAGIGGLVLVGASTGSGKTRACAAMASAMSGRSTRLTVALGLRSLTLQTYRSYSDEIGLKEEEVDFVIGSRAYKDLNVADGLDNDLAAEKEEYETYGGSWHGTHDLLPPILAQCRGRGDRRYLDVPVMVCTIDQIIKAADHRRSGWIKPWLRLQSSRALIIDEVDGFGLEDTPALLRLIYFSAVMGVHVLVSSATIYPALARRVAAAYNAGTRQRMEMMGADTATRVAIVGDADGANIIVACDDFPDAFDACSKVARAHLGKDDRRKFAYIGDDADSPDRMREVVMRTCLDLHERNRFMVDTPSGQTGVSVGMVKMLHIKQVVAMALHLDKWVVQADESTPMVRAIIYHSRNTMLGRAYIEQHLDAMLKRKGGASPADHPPVANLANKAAAQGRDALIIIITTLEEVGQDHDYDWAVIEPSSARGIVQTCGRVLRHRNTSPNGVNVAIMRHNFRYLEHDPRNRKTRSCFCRPGFESGDREGALFPKPLAVHSVAADSCLLPPDGTLGWYDNDSIDRYLSGSIDKWIGSVPLQASCAHYENYGFRKHQQQIPVVLQDDASKAVIAPDKAVCIGRILKNSDFLSASWKDVSARFDMNEFISQDYRTFMIYEHTKLEYVDPVYGAIYKMETDAGDAT